MIANAQGERSSAELLEATTKLFVRDGFFAHDRRGIMEQEATSK